MKTINCHCCAGSGKELDRGDVSRRMRTLRKNVGLSIAALAVRIHVTESYLCHLEKGRRHWRPELIAAYLKHCK